MSPFTTLATAIAIALIASTLTVIAIREPLRRQLDALCATGTSATYWTRTAVTVLYLLPLFVVLVFGVPDLTRPDMTVTPAEVARRTIAAAAFALVTIVAGMGLRIAGQRPPARPPSPTIERY